MKMFPVFTFFLLAIQFSCTNMGGEKITGNGQITTQQRKVAAFTDVEIHGGIKVHLRQDTLAPVRLETDANLMEYVEVESEGGTLVIKPKSNYNLDPSREVIVYISAPSYKKIDLSGASGLVSDNTIAGAGELLLECSGASAMRLEVNMSELNIDLSGSSEIELKGQAREVDANLAGASMMRGFDLVAINASIDLSGSSEAEVYANENLDAQASGASELRYKGAAKVESKTSGSSSVNRVK
ncbi:MAG TPA: head GIN domain-containing protein [Flavisolibacter sp.]|nr:head GIN domain-containing protein [Flavisolibacter sp.]